MDKILSAANFTGIESESEDEGTVCINDYTAQLGDQQKQLGEELDPTEAYRGNDQFNEMDWKPYHKALQDIIRGFSDLTKVRIRHFFKKQYEETINLLERAFFKQEQNSLMLLSRSK